MLRAWMRCGLLLSILATTVGCATERGNISDEAVAAGARTQMLIRECKYDEAEALVQSELEAAGPDDRGILLLAAGNVAEHRGKLAEAIAHYQAATVGPSVPAQAFRLLGRAFVANRQFEHGYQPLLGFVAHRLRTSNVMPAWQDIAALAIAMAETGRLDEARSLLDKASGRYEAYDPLLLALQEKVNAVAPGKERLPGEFWTLGYGDGLAMQAASTDFWPKPLRRVAPVYPSSAAKRALEGTALAEVSVDANGKVIGARVVRATTPAFGEAAATALRRWEFAPAMRRCQPVPFKGIQRFDFRMAR